MDIPDEMFITPAKFKELQLEGFPEWTLLSADVVCKSWFDTIESEEDIVHLFEEEWKNDTLGWSEHKHLKKVQKIIILEHNLMELEKIAALQLEYWKNLEKTPWLFIYDRGARKPSDPTEGMKFGWFGWIRNGKLVSLRAKISRMADWFWFIENINSFNIQKTKEEIIKQARIKKSDLDRWEKRARKANLWDEDEFLVDGGRIRVLRNHWKVNSNFNRSGRFVITNKRILMIRKKFFLAGLSPTALLPLPAFVRPANKVIMVARLVQSYLAVPIRALAQARPALSGLWPAIAGLLVYVSFNVDLSSIIDPIVAFFSNLSGIGALLPALSFGVQFALERPEILPSLAGMYALFRLGFIKAFFRSEEIVSLPFHQVRYLLIHNNMIFGRWEVKGIKTVGAKKGIEYRFRVSHHSVSRDNSLLKFAISVFSHILTHGEIIDQEATAEEMPIVQEESISDQASTKT